MYKIWKELKDKTYIENFQVKNKFSRFVAVLLLMDSKDLSRYDINLSTRTLRDKLFELISKQNWEFIFNFLGVLSDFFCTCSLFSRF